jgi:UrcA family protein
MNKTALTLAVVFATASAMLPGYAHAADAGSTEQTIIVKTADLDLASTKGQSTLKSRIATAARSVCFANGFAQAFDYDRCVVIAKSEAKAASATLIAAATAQRTQIAAR